jgi:alanyl-tRNA synthetase
MASTEWTVSKVRATFIEFFQSKGCECIASSSCVPHNDPTLLFTNAGMNQFKSKFLGTTEPSSPLFKMKGSVNSQKCIRAGGKHNDLDDVGRDTYHHTFFEMMGNWSFGDYFKRESIAWAWELLTVVYKLDPERLYVSYYEGDEPLGLEADAESYEEWLKYVPAERIVKGNTKDNFWEMGDVGPCGMSSEIHYDMVGGGRDAAHLVNVSDDVIEIWNLVFIQFNRAVPNGPLAKLNENHVDTGLGLERLCTILQGKKANYDIDVFQSVFAGLETLTGAGAYGGRFGDDDVQHHDMAYRVVADHMRTLVFAIGDGQLLDNDGRGYVLRRILRRALRYARRYLGATRIGVLADLVPYVIGSLADAYPDVVAKRDEIMDEVRLEEQRFSECLTNGTRQFEKRLERLGEDEALPIGDAVDLYVTYGFPGDLTIRMLEDAGRTPFALAQFEAALEASKDRSQKSFSAFTGFGFTPMQLAQLGTDGVPTTDDSPKYERGDTLAAGIEATVLALFDGDAFVDELRVERRTPAASSSAASSSSSAEQAGGGDDEEGELEDEELRSNRMVAVFFDATCFYAEGGGQACDHGVVALKQGDGKLVVRDVQKYSGYVAHIGYVSSGTLKRGERTLLGVDVARRRPIASNHTTTHMLNWALRSTLGDHVEQRGSSVLPTRFRFDYKQRKAMNGKQLASVTDDVNKLIESDVEVFDQVAPRSLALKIKTLRFLPEETYPLQVRVVSVGQPVERLIAEPDSDEFLSYSVEFCGGTHMARTGEAQQFEIVSEEALGAGVRRIIGVTGAEAAEARASGVRLLQRLRDAEQLPAGQINAALPALRVLVDDKKTPVPADVRFQCRAILAALDAKNMKAIKAGRKDAGRKSAEFADAAIAALGADGAPRHYIAAIDVDGDRRQIAAALKKIVAAHRDAAILVVSTNAQAKKPSTVVSAQVPKAHRFSAADWAKAAVEPSGGRGGGSQTIGNATVPGVDKLQQILNDAQQFADK